MQDMILIVTPSSRGSHCAELVGNALHQETKLVLSMRQALSAVRSQEYRVVVIDEDLFEASPAAALGVSELAEGAIPVFLNFGIASPERILREVKAALQRREREELAARQSAALQLQGELGNDLTGILVTVQAALNLPDTPAAVHERLQRLYDNARRLQLRLQSNG